MLCHDGVAGGDQESGADGVAGAVMDIEEAGMARSTCWVERVLLDGMQGVCC